MTRSIYGPSLRDSVSNYGASLPTPGPWDVCQPSELNSSGYIVNAKGKRSICTMTGKAFYGDCPTAKENFANANLIAAAPELLDMLKYLVSYTKCNGIKGTTDAMYSFNESTMNQIKQAISKAERSI